MKKVRKNPIVIRIPIPKPGKAFRNKNVYSRKNKHKNDISTK